jgi:hypothetical protein
MELWCLDRHWKRPGLTRPQMAAFQPSTEDTLEEASFATPRRVIRRNRSRTYSIPMECPCKTRQNLDASASMKPDDVGSALLTVPDDLASTFPAQAARQMGWGLVPMMCAREVPVPDSLREVIRVLVH